jgi:putative ABC transport system permease protein
MFADIRYAFRQLRKAPLFALITIATLALGIGANTAIFSAVKAVLLDQLPYRDPSRLVKVAEADPDNPIPQTVDFTTTHDLRSRSHSFESLSLFRDGGGAFVEQGQPEVLEGTRIGFDYFDTLGIKMQLGRTFLPEEDHPQTRFEAILTHGLWLRRFGGDPSVIGRTIRLSGRSFTVVGVLPESFRPFVRSDRSELPEIYTPLGYDLALDMACRGCQHLQLIGRLKPGVSVEQARAELNTIMRDIVRENPKEYAARTVIAVMPLRDYLVGSVSIALWILLGAVGFVLLIACANVAHLAMARAASRSREMAVRSALGADRGRLVRQLLTENLLLSLMGGATGLLLAYWGMNALAGLSPKELPRAQEIRLDTPVLLFALFVSILTGLLFGVVPALRASRVSLNDALKDSGRTTEGRSRHGYRDLLVTVELALAFALLMGAGLLGKSLLRLVNVSPGYDPHNVLTAGVYVYGERYKKAEAELSFYEQVMERLRATPGIEGAAMASVLPMASSDRRGFHIQDRPLANESEAPSPDAYSVSPDYFNVMRIPLKRGRLFTAEDRAGAPGVALISESCARAVFPNEDPIGKHIQLGGRDDKKEWMTIIGIVGDVRQYALDRPSAMEVYIAQAQNMNFGFDLVVRTTGDPQLMEADVRKAFLAVDPTQPVYQVQPLERYVAESMAARRYTLLLLGIFGTLAIVLAAVGIYGVVSYTMSLRTRELGIRVALGAARKDVMRLVLWRGLTMIAVGLFSGLVLSLSLTRFLSSLLYKVRPTDVGTLTLVALILAGVALLANYLPARRASRVDPMNALRCE